MCSENETEVAEIHLLGFQSLHNLRPLLFVVLLLLYIAIAGGNLSIVFLVMISDSLKTPMFFFLKHLAVADVLVTTSVVPMMLEIVLKSNPSISVGGCITQLYFFCIFGFVQCFLLAVMSYDRYVALSNPFHYIVFMKTSLCFQLAFGSWAIIFSITTSEFILIGQFEFCDRNSLDQFFCDYSPLVELSTSDTTIVLWIDFIFSIFSFFVPLTFILVTYIYIFIAIFKIRSSTGRQKTFSTCSSHLTSVCVYYGTFIAIYIVPSNESLSVVDKYRSLLYTVVTPLINPIIYSLRNHELNQALHKRMHQFLNSK
ncbi:olfactory receptor 5P64-like [Pyxicephalus adspersus]|uniref:olfactory receptor 5P64-like n=1 Tax=Pyxicephalus adspersus TaxID=30357 RepID=UPI003B5AA7B5